MASHRLVRRICSSCRESVAIDPATLAALRQRPDFAATVSVLRREGLLGEGDVT